MLIAACSGTESDEQPSSAGGRQARQLTITEMTTGESTRATLSADGDELSALWTAGDKLSYCNLSALTQDYYSGETAPTWGALTAITTASTSSFEGSVVCSKGDKLAVVYPAATFGWADSDEAQYTLTLSGQDGTLSTLASRYHYVYGLATVTAADEANATATMPKMKSLLTVCRFSFKDEATDEAILPVSLDISYAADGLDGNADTYPQTATVTAGIDQSSVAAKANTSSTQHLTITPTTPQTEMYVALLPTGGQRTFRFTVTDSDNNTYTGTARATLNAGEYVEATGLKLTRI